MQQLVTRKIIRQETEVDAFYKAPGLSCANTSTVSGTFIIFSITEVDNEHYMFEAADVISGVNRQIDSRNVTRVDGMNPDRLASVYNLDKTGNDMKPAKRRGRKPSSQVDWDVDEDESDEDLLLEDFLMNSGLGGESFSFMSA